MSGEGRMHDGRATGVQRSQTPIAHTKNARGERHDLVAHLQAVAELAGEFGSKFGAGKIARAVGLWHDLGKFHPDFQDYLYRSELEPGSTHRGPDHKAAGSSFAANAWFMAMIVAGHHGGLRDKEEFSAWLHEKQSERGEAGKKRFEEALDIARAYLPELEAARDAAVAEYAARWRAASKRQLEQLIRMVFSCLVDADFLDTERHFHRGLSAERGSQPRLGDLWPEFEAHHSAVQAGSKAASHVLRVRREVYDACLEAAEREQGFFRLTVPTGGGKTLSGLAFGLKHARTYAMDRVIFAVPYTSICEQTTAAYRDVLRNPRVVLEHHSAANLRDPDAPVTAQAVWGRLAAENWDAPVIVTTTVQLFESLLARNTSECRKLHSIANSVVVLDEAQTLPSHLLDPIIDVLGELVRVYGVSVVFCTATQPDLETALGSLSVSDVREIVPDHARHFAELKRTRYERPDEPWDWQQVAGEMVGADQALAILNTRQQAQELAMSLQQRGIAPLHLSTQMCGAHRLAVLQRVRKRLRDGESCHLVSTQVVEAGVDLDFPLLLRAFGPLDRIVQAAGRCNRNGLLESGRVVIFQPEERKLPPGDYRIATDVTELMWRERSIDLDEPATFPSYFQRFYDRINRDRQRVQSHRESWGFRKVAELARVIEDETFLLVVPYGGWSDALRQVESNSVLPRVAWRQLQPFCVGLRSYEFAKAKAAGLVRPVREDVDLHVWEGPYDEVFGLDLTAIDGIDHERLAERPDWS